ncbi:CAP domain-containing protein [Christiangramia echinicola]|uniref:Cysteine-rich secretory protein family protein n=1 Tax=Christiangramia echinicola TaxID=279359 RepID=A0A1H1R4H6_9FLAO|nr:CAP domain-containing protein [Christiangramia echinicola]SDS30612.1 Cysteine-rich secretory protein family protein [Christiangramia echinicola]
MKKITLTGITFIFCAVFLTSCSKDNIEDELTSYDQVVTEKAEYSYNTIEVEILEEINIYRKALGLSELKAMAELSVESEDHNEYMIEEGLVSHDNFSLRASKLMNKVGARAVAENVGFGYRTSEAVVNAWLKSKGHRENVEGEYSHIGISVRQDENGKNYFTNIFIKK